MNEVGVGRVRGAAATRLLVVADEQQFLELLELSLQLSGFEVTSAISGMAALACAQRQSFDVILLDLLMAPWDGFETARQLSALPAPPPLIFLGDQPSSAEDLHAWSGAFLPKPFRPSQLVTLIKQTLEER